MDQRVWPMALTAPCLAPIAKGLRPTMASPLALRDYLKSPVQPHSKMKLRVMGSASIDYLDVMGPSSLNELDTNGSTRLAWGPNGPLLGAYREGSMHHNGEPVGPEGLLEVSSPAIFQNNLEVMGSTPLRVRLLLKGQRP